VTDETLVARLRAIAHNLAALNQPYGVKSISEAADEIERLQSELAAVRGKADETMRVPIDPTEAMVEAGRKAMAPETFVSHARVIWTWQAMLEAVILPPLPQRQPHE
jgi:hypothetical protein